MCEGNSSSFFLQIVVAQNGLPPTKSNSLNHSNPTKMEHHINKCTVIYHYVSLGFYQLLSIMVVPTSVRLRFQMTSPL